MNSALQTFQSREPFYVPYSVPTNDSLADGGPGVLTLPPPTVILDVTSFEVIVRNVREARFFRVYAIQYEFNPAHSTAYRHVVTATNDYPESTDPVVIPSFDIFPGYYVVTTGNALGESAPSPAFLRLGI